MSQPSDQELQPEEPMLPLTKRPWESGTVIEALKLCRVPSRFIFGPPGKPDPFELTHGTYVVKPYEPQPAVSFSKQESFGQLPPYGHLGRYCRLCDTVHEEFPPCSPPASQPVAELAAPTLASGEGLATAGGAGGCCERMGLWRYEQEIGVKPRWHGLGFVFCPWCGTKLEEGESSRQGDTITIPGTKTSWADWWSGVLRGYEERGGKP